MWVIAIDLGGTVIKTGLFNETGLIATELVVVGLADGLKNKLSEIEHVVDLLVESNGVKPGHLAGIGFAFSGLVDSIKNRVISTNKKYDEAITFDFVKWAKSKWGVPLFLENDARMALLGEWQYGAGKGCSDIVSVTLGTGFGSAVLINGKLLVGKHFQAGNLGGHLVVNHQGTKCTCGNVGCVEAEASTWRLPSLLTEHPDFLSSSIKDEDVLDFKALFNHASSNDSLAKEVLRHCLSVWSAGIISMVHAFDPELIILSGGIMKSSSVILPVLQQKVNQLAWTPWGKVKLVEADYPDFSALYGGNYLVRSKLDYEL